MTSHLTAALAQTPWPEAAPLWGTLSYIGAQSVQIRGLSGVLGLGDMIEIRRNTGPNIEGEIIALEGEIGSAIIFGRVKGLRIGERVFIKRADHIAPSQDWIGRVLGYDGRTVDGELPELGDRPVALQSEPPKAILRKALGPRLKTGTHAFDTFLPLCQGQRVGLFAGSGVGKSTLLGTLAKGSNADINIIALIGERGREVRAFVEHTLGPEGMARSIIFVATSDQASSIRLRAANLAMATAEYFRDEGQQVLFMCDSLSRYADAHRDVALSAGEVPSLRAYPPSTFGALSAYCERTGPGIEGTGDITAIFSVLVAGSNMEEPVADMVRGILDGHIILDRTIAERGRYPAINMSRSVSRSLPEAATAAQNQILSQARELIVHYEQSETLIQAGLYVKGSDPKLDIAINAYPELDAFIGSLSEGEIENSFETLAAILEAAQTQTSNSQTPTN